LAKIVPNGYMTLKVELAATEIVRTIVVPENMTLEIACVKSNGPENEEYSEMREWASLDTAEDLKKYLDGESLGQKTKKLRRALSHVKPPVQDAAKQEKPMTEEEKASSRRTSRTLMVMCLELSRSVTNWVNCHTG